MKIIITILLAAFAASSYAKSSYLCDRIGSGETNSVPVEIISNQNGKQYFLTICGKGDFVGVLVKDNSRSYNVRLFEPDLDILSSLNTIQTNSNGQFMIQVKNQRTEEFRKIKLDSKDDVSLLILRIVYIAELPEYKVVMGDTFSGILKNKLNGKYSKSEILAVNPGLIPDQIREFQRIKLPRK